MVLGCYQKFLNPGPITKSSVSFMFFAHLREVLVLNELLKCNQSLFGYLFWKKITWILVIPGRKKSEQKTLNLRK